MRSETTAMALAALCSCAPGMSQAPNRPSSAPAEASALDCATAIAEVESLHAFFVQWFRGELPDTDAAYDRFSSALSPDFEMVVPSGAQLEHAAVLAGVRSAHGQWRDDPTAMIEVRNAKAHALGGGLVRVSYEEWQRTDGAWKGRRSTALLQGRADGVTWLHVHETWVGGG